jgi:elongation factor Ts
MAEISSQMIKELRESTGAGMLDCKKALEESNGDVEGAKDWLRKKGLSKAAKKASRSASEGLVAIHADAQKGVLVEINSETDFVAKNDQFQDFAKTVLDLAKDANDLDDLLSKDYGNGKKVSEELTSKIATIGENLIIRRFAKIETTNGVIASYLHNQVTPELGKIGVLVAIEGSDDQNKLLEVGKKVAMHIAASSPLSLSKEEIPADVVERERQIYSEQAKASGKPDDIIAKMVEGRINKFYQEAVLLEQAFVMDPNQKVKDFLKEEGDLKVTAYQKFTLGEGVEKKEEDFAEEVKKASGNQ